MCKIKHLRTKPPGLVTNCEISKLKLIPDKRDREKVEEKKSKWYLRNQRKRISRKQSIF